jgi:hypothetical protein
MAGAVSVLFAVDAAGKSEGRRVAGFLGAACVLFAITIFGAEIRPDRGGTDCYTEWDMRASRTACR